MTLQCEAKTLNTTYSPSHRCLKRGKLRKHRGRSYCVHHMAMIQGRGK